MLRSVLIRQGGLPIATLRDVASRVGVSMATVSRALSGHPHVDEELRGRVVRAARDLGYRPNVLARSLRLQSTRTIGLIIPDIRNDFFAESASVLQHALEERGFRLMLCISGNDPTTDRSYVRTLVEHRVDGIVHVPSAPIGNRELEAGGRAIPAVELLRHTPGAPFDAIVADDREGAAALTTHLLALGHRRVAMITGPDDVSTTRYRVDGFRDAIARFPEAVGAVHHGPWTAAFGAEATRRILAADSPPTAIFSSGSPPTAGVLGALRDAGVAVPAQISVVAYEDPEWYSLAVPPLTCYALPLREMGRVAAETIVARVQEPGERRPPTLVRFSGRLVERGSAGPPPEAPLRRPR